MSVISCTVVTVLALMEAHDPGQTQLLWDCDESTSKTVQKEEKIHDTISFLVHHCPSGLGLGKTFAGPGERLEIKKCQIEEC